MKYFFCILFTCISLRSASQISSTVYDALEDKVIGKRIIERRTGYISEAIYLGEVSDLSGHVKYYIIKEILKIAAALVYHGHSNIYIFNTNNKKIAYIEVGMPNNLPLKLKGNSLYFRNIDETGESKLFKQNISNLPNMLCINPNDCYIVQF